MKYLSIIQHTQSEWLGHIEDHLEGRGIRFGYSRPFTAGGTLPDVETIGDGLILLGGGPWGAASPDRLLPTLDPEVRLVRACLMLGKPIVGFGIGSQILCLAAEGKVEQAPLRFKVGAARRAKPDALNGFLPETLTSIVYMRDQPEPPAYAEVLAVDEAGEPALFQIGANAFGFVGHPGLRPAMIEDLIMEFDDEVEDCADTLSRLPSAAARLEDELVPIMTGLIQRTDWMTG